MRHSKPVKKTKDQVKAAVKRFENNYNGWRLQNALDKYFMNNWMTEEASEYLNNKIEEHKQGEQQ